MKVLVDAAPIRSGGGIQVAVEHHRNLQGSTRHTVAWRLSEPVRAAIEREGLPLPSAWEIDKPGLRGAAQLWRLAGAADVVFTVFGPPRLPRYPVPHLCGYGSAWTLQPHSVAWDAMPPRDRLSLRATEALRAQALRWADAWVVETATAARGIERLLGVAESRVHVVGNTCGDPFRDPTLATPSGRVERLPGAFHLLLLAAYYPHKQIQILPAVAEALGRIGGPPVRFVLTLPPEGEGWAQVRAEAERRGVAEAFCNVGPVPARECPSLYLACDAVILPSLIETFSANYPEAMQMGRPILTSDLDFARDICGPAARYVQPRDIEGWAHAIKELAADPRAREALVAAGKERLTSFPDSRARTAAVVEILEALVGRGSA